MAAGIGNRMRPFSAEIPKPLLPVMGVPVIQYAIDQLVEAGITDVIVNVHHLSDLMKAGLSKLDWQGLRCQVSDESELLLGSAGGLKKAESFFSGEPFVYLNSDVMSTLSVKNLVSAYQQQKSKNQLMTLLIHAQSPSGEKYRSFELNKELNQVTGFSKELCENVPFFSGAAILESSLLLTVPIEPCDFVPQILNEKRVLEGCVGAIVESGLWFDIGKPETWLNAHIQLLKSLESNENQLPARWVSRIKKSSRRIGDQVWVKHWSLIPKHFEASCYFDIDRYSTVDAVGSNAVIYGSFSNEHSQLNSNFISWNELEFSKVTQTNSSRG